MLFMSLNFARLTSMAVLLSIVFFALVSPSRAAELSDAEVDALFKRHPATMWKALAERWDEIKAKMTTPVENLSLPLEYHPNGLVRARLFAERSQIFEDGMIFASGVKVALYDDKGVLDGFLKAKDCIFDREASHGYCKGRVEVKYGSDVIRGVGMYFSISGEYIKILSDCEIRTKRFQGNLGRLL